MKSILFKCIAFILCFLIMLGSGPAGAVAMPGPSQNILRSASIYYAYSASPTVAWFWRWRRPKGDTGNLPNTVSGGRRGKCSAIRQNFKAIVPLPLESSLEPPLDPLIEVGTEASRDSTENVEDLFRLTDNPSPKLWFYTAALPSEVSQGELMIQVVQENGRGKEIDVSNMPVSISDIPIEKSGIFSIEFGRFESLRNILKVGERYKWYFSLICEESRPSRNPSVGGWIRYEPYDEENVLSSLSNRQRIEQYLDRRFWHSALTLAVEAQCQPDPNGTNKANWVELIESIGFGPDVSQAEVLSCS